LCGDQTCKEAFPVLYSIARVNVASMTNYLELSSSSHLWNVIFIRAAHDWEVEVFTSFFDLLYCYRLRQGGEDELRWVPSMRGMFDVRSFYNVLVPYDNTHFPWKSMWWHNAPLRVAFFVWTAALGKILIMDNIMKRLVIVVYWCCICKKTGETVDLLLLHCEIPTALWSAIFSRLELAQVMLRRVVYLFACWRMLGGSPQSAVVWKTVPSCFL
jgi:hypothetical protein